MIFLCKKLVFPFLSLPTGAQKLDFQTLFFFILFNIGAVQQSRNGQHACKQNNQSKNQKKVYGLCIKKTVERTTTAMGKKKKKGWFRWNDEK